MQRVFVCDRKSTCPLFDFQWDWLVDARPSDISSLVFLFFQFTQSVDADSKDSEKSKSSTTQRTGLGTRETVRVVFEHPIARRSSRRLKERIMRYANKINMASRSSRQRGRLEIKPQSIAMVTAASKQIRVALFCEATFNSELSRLIAEQILQSFMSLYEGVLKKLEPEFLEEAKDQNEARTHLKYMKQFRGFVEPLSKLVASHPKSNCFGNQTVTSFSGRSFPGSVPGNGALDEDTKADSAIRRESNDTKNSEKKSLKEKVDLEMESKFVEVGEC
mmetsp:Transcript_2746/g.3974  ORF Transcript_2746/g.3974 Transcript_2746/m.3974 type:complete len:276 (+) Transcript_2746:78-905(+)|eukprot:CAMPEP_0167749682 /NCGR_PEP_ID=MMETSP0110_2-20121227/5554_1 /TAXON_ID=629695 /ORGANISM="Gymnochlora sp., Strain CCMP2014" /LENGTH=275 /DNA_ID=CAMNT_0007634885 /DNA_START=42 /DNA_END=869 /DNA_ORIENTATION=-